jgi:UDP-3-O-[3-hydroxymyristoyl] glucosamine N-acyltransferase
MSFTVAELARRCGGSVHGDATAVIADVATLEAAGPTDIAYVASGKYHALLERTRAGAVIVSEAEAERFAGTSLIVDNPRLCFARVAALLHAQPCSKPGVHPTAVIDPLAQIAPTSYVGAHAVVEAGVKIEGGVFVGAGCFIGHDSHIGAHSHLATHVFIGANCVLGARCFLQPGAVIGSDGFGYVKDGEAWIKVPQLGRVIIGDDVEIGANTTVDRGALGDTIIGDGVKLDNLIQIAHNVQIGDHTAMAGCVGVAGSAVIGKHCTLAGGVGIAGHLEVGDNVHVTAMSLIATPVPAGETYSSSLPAEPARQWQKNAVRLRRLDEIARRLKKVEQSLEQILAQNATGKDD